MISDAKFRQLHELAVRLQQAAPRNSDDGADWLRRHAAVLAGVAADLRGHDVVVAEYATSTNDLLHGHVAARMDRRSFEERVIAALCDAVGDRMRKTGRITVIFLDGAQGAIAQESRALAIAAKLPVLFVEDARAKQASSAKKGKKQAALEYPSIPVDTQDVIALYRVAHESIARARDGGGPTHMVGMQWQPAAGGNKRGASEGPVAHLEQWLMARGLPVEEWRREIAAESEANQEKPSFNAQQAANGAGEGEDTETRAIA
ncbi:MAG: thiamine pyrophosphate-dependent enzyme [Acidobacteriaceae bacterium]